MSDINATAAAIELASEYGIDISEVAGSGANERVTKADVEAFVTNRDPADEDAGDDLETLEDLRKEMADLKSALGASSLEDKANLATVLQKLESRLSDMQRPFGVTLPEMAYSRRPMGYCGKNLDRGQIVRLQGARNDEKLYRIGYFVDLPQGFDIDRDARTCAICGAQFVDDATRTIHGNARHENVCICGRHFDWPEQLDRHRIKCDAVKAQNRRPVMA